MMNIVPIKMYEYMAAGKPVIATRLPGVMKEFGEDHGVIHIDNPEDLLEKANEILDNGYAAQEGHNARIVIEKYKWNEMI